MKKLDNKGWSMATMFGLLAVLLLFIIVVAILSWRAGIAKSAPGTVYDNAVPNPNESVIENG